MQILKKQKEKNKNKNKERESKKARKERKEGRKKRGYSKNSQLLLKLICKNIYFKQVKKSFKFKH